MDIKLEINGQLIAINEGATLMEAASKVGIYVPHFCYHEKLSIAANCRMCMVEVEKLPKAVPACATRVIDGMVVRTDSKRAKAAQHGVMEFLLINHPLDCPICDQGGECQLQDLAVGYGLSRSHYQEEKRVVFEKNLGPLIATDMTRCIHCTRCVRFGREVAGMMELGMTGRGEHAEIMPFVERTVDSELSGNMIDLCPVGALTSKPFRFAARSWELTRHRGVGSHDSWGSHLILQSKGSTIKRVLPDRSPGIHEHWISDRDRFSYEGLLASDRARFPATREYSGNALREAPWRLAIDTVATYLRRQSDAQKMDKIGFFISPRASCEEAFLYQRIVRHLGGHNLDYRLLQRDFSSADVVGLGVDNATLKSLQTVLFIGAEPARELPLLAAFLRQRSSRKKYLSIGAMDIATQIPLALQLLQSPSDLAVTMVRLVLVAGGHAPAGWEPEVTDLFNVTDSSSQLIETMVKHLRQAADKGVIWLGDVARTAPQYGLIVAMAKQLSTLLGVHIGTLADGANGVGVHQAGARPNQNGLNTAAMLRADLEAVFLFRCEPADFSESALAESMLAQSDFVCAMTSYTSVFNQHATVLLPTAEWSETAASIINGQGQTVHFSAATPPPGKARPGWKILRLLGEYLNVPGFDFDDLSAISDSCQYPVTTTLLSPAYQHLSDESGFCCYGGAPIYGGDMLVRRADALQATQPGRAATLVGMNQDSMQQAGVEAGDQIIISDGENEWESNVRLDECLATGVIRFWSPTLTASVGLSIRPKRQEKIA